MGILWRIGYFVFVNTANTNICNKQNKTKQKTKQKNKTKTKQTKKKNFLSVTKKVGLAGIFF